MIHSNFAIAPLILLLCMGAMAIDEGCNATRVTGTVGEVFPSVLCVFFKGSTPFISPRLPPGLVGIVKTVSIYRALEISGIPLTGLNTQLFDVYDSNHHYQVTIEIYGKPTYLSYGFISRSIYPHVPLVPLLPRSDSTFTEVIATPALPNGLTIRSINGEIRGTPSGGQFGVSTHTIIAKNAFGEVQTKVSFEMKSSDELNEYGCMRCMLNQEFNVFPTYEMFSGISRHLCFVKNTTFFTKISNNAEESIDGVDFHYTYAVPVVTEFYFYAEYEGMYSLSVAAMYSDVNVYIDSIDTPFLYERSGPYDPYVDNNKTYLTAGYHYMISNYIFTGKTIRHSLGYQYNKTYGALSGDRIRLGAAFPRFIRYPRINGIVETVMESILPEMGSYSASIWTVKPALPRGITLDENYGRIYGKPRVEGQSMHTITVSSPYGTAESIISVNIVKQPDSGMIAKYYMTTSLPSFQSLSLYNMGIITERIETAINHPYHNPLYIWEGLDAMKLTRFFVVWEGYLYHNVVGLWQFSVECTYCVLWREDNNRVIDNWMYASLQLTMNNATRYISTPGYYYYRLEYASLYKEKYGDSMVFKWKRPNEEWSIVDGDDMFHINPSEVYYPIMAMTIFENTSLSINPIITPGKQASSFSIVPPLPEGISIDAINGTISGSTSVLSDMAKYMVNYVMDGETHSLSLYLDVVRRRGPVYCQWSDGKTNITSHARLTTSKEYVLAKDLTKDANNTYSVAPTLPNGMSLDPFEGTIRSNSLESTSLLSEIEFTLTAMNPAGSCSIYLTYNVGPCWGEDDQGNKWNNTMFVLHVYKGTAHISVNDNDGKVIKCGSITDADGKAVMKYACEDDVLSDNDFHMCMPRSEEKQTVYLTCLKGPCDYMIMREDGMVVYAGSSDYTVAFPPAVIPATSFTLSRSNQTIVQSESIGFIGFSLNGAFRKVIVSPYLNATITSSGFLYEEPLFEVGTTVYTFSALIDTTWINTTYSLTVLPCNHNHDASLVSFIVVQNMGTELHRFRVSNSGGTVFEYDCVVGNVVYDIKKCMKNGDYSMELVSYCINEWAPMTYRDFAVKDANGRNIYLGSFPEIEKCKIGYSKSQTVDVTINEHTGVAMPWFYLCDAEAPKDWMTKDFNYEKWKKWENSISWKQNQAYFVGDYTQSNLSNVFFNEIGLFYKYHVVVYINGDQVLDEGTKEGISNYVNYKYIHDRDEIKEGRNRIAILVERASTREEILKFDCYFHPLEGRCQSVATDGEITDSFWHNTRFAVAKHAWDPTTYLAWVEHGIPAWNIFSFYNDRRYVNSFRITSDRDDISNNAEHIRLYGSNDEYTWDLLLEEERITWIPKEVNTLEYRTVNHTEKYKQYKFEVLKSVNDMLMVTVDVIELLQCEYTVCQAGGGYNETYVYMNGLARCDNHMIGEKVKRCEKKNDIGVWEEEESHCLDNQPSAGKAYIDTAIFVKNTTKDAIDKNNPALARAFEEVMTLNENTATLWYVREEKEPDQCIIWIRIDCPNDARLLEVVIDKIPRLIRYLTKWATLLDVKKIEDGIHVTPFATVSSSPTQPPTQPPTQSPTQPPTQPPTQSPTQSPTQPPTQAPTQAPTIKPRNKTILVILVLVALAIMIVFAMYMWNRMKKTKRYPVRVQKGNYSKL